MSGRDLYGEPVNAEAKAICRRLYDELHQPDLFDAGRGDFPGQRVAFDPVDPAVCAGCGEPLPVVSAITGERVIMSYDGLCVPCWEAAQPN